MSTILIETEAFQEIMKKLEVINEKLNNEKSRLSLSEVWLDNSEICKLLNISKRTLQHYRDSALLPFSQIGAKIYYKTSDIELLLSKHYRN
ncbi:MAG: helix-turn-helix domain-containing protein [Lutibacter sp.]|nr:helix-turn-helix domain-containing protein [Lutibacter sp.]